MTDFEQLPAPLTPPDCNLRGLPFMPLHTERLLDSDMMALSSGEEFKIALRLWCKSWNQEPAASLPDDDRILAHLAGKELSAWRKVRGMALRGFVKCSDGRLYHPVIAEEAIKAMAKREEHQAAKDGDNERKREEREDRKLLFAALRDVGVILPAKGTSTSHLREVAASRGISIVVTEGHKVVTVTPHGSHTESHGGVTAKTGTGTGTYIKEGGGSAREPPTVDNSPGYLPDPTPCGVLAKRLRAEGVDVAPGRPDFREWVEKGLTEGEALAAVEAARQSKPAPESIPWTYLAKVLTRARQAAQAVPAKPDKVADKPAQDADRWWMSDGGIDRKGRELGMFARGGESYPAFKDRIFAELRRRRDEQERGT